MGFIQGKFTRIAFVTAVSFLGVWPVLAEDLKIGLIGLDTSHVIAFTRILNDEKAKDHVSGAKVVAAFKGGSPDVESSRTRIDKYTQQLQNDYGVKLYPTIEEMCRHVDAVMLESVDGRPHLQQAIPVMEAGKVLFIDKPLAGNLADAFKIFRLAKKHGVPVFSSSSLRYGKSSQDVRAGSIGRVVNCQTYSPCYLEPHHPDLFWYGIHGVESLFTVMGRGCLSVRRDTTEDGKIRVTGEWAGKRTGVFVEGKGYGGSARGEKGEAAVGSYDGYAPLVVDVIRFFQTKEPSVDLRETLEIYAFMEAADESKRRGGARVSLREVIERHGGGDLLKP